MERFEILRRAIDQIESNGLVVQHEAFTILQPTIETEGNRANIGAQPLSKPSRRRAWALESGNPVEFLWAAFRDEPMIPSAGLYATRGARPGGSLHPSQEENEAIGKYALTMPPDEEECGAQFFSMRAAVRRPKKRHSRQLDVTRTRLLSMSRLRLPGKIRG